MRFMAMVLLVACVPAWAVNGGGGDPVPSGAVSGSSSVATSGAAAGAIAGAEGGDSTAVANGGTAYGGNGGSAVGEVNVSGDDYDRPAPGIAMTHPMATMDCIRGFGVGGSNVNGSLIIGPQWKDGDCMALAQFTQLSELGLAEPAARAYCARPRFAGPFGGEDQCFTTMRDHIAWLHKPAEPAPVVIEDVACRESLRRCENVTGK